MANSEICWKFWLSHEKRHGISCEICRQSVNGYQRVNEDTGVNCSRFLYAKIHRRFITQVFPVGKAILYYFFKLDFKSLEEIPYNLSWLSESRVTLKWPNAKIILTNFELCHLTFF